MLDALRWSWVRGWWLDINLRSYCYDMDMVHNDYSSSIIQGWGLRARCESGFFLGVKTIWFISSCRTRPSLKIVQR